MLNLRRLALTAIFPLLLANLAIAQNAKTPKTKTQKSKSDAKDFVYKKTKQADLKIHVHYPPGWKASDKRPAIVFFFGGGWNAGKVTQFEPQAQHFASRGLVTARADYRVKSRHQVSPRECVLDAKSAVRWLRENAGKLGIDPERIVSAGGSAGGHIAACTYFSEGLEPEGENTSVSSKPNVLLLYNPVLRFAGVPRLMSRLGKNEKLGETLSPTLHIAKNMPPTLLFFGDKDELKSQGDEFVKKAKAAGIDVGMFVAEGAGHGFFNREPWLARTTARADAFLSGLGYLDKK